ncbi:MAG: ATP-binding protein [Fluviicoccus sp.]|uniref:ATP-binding protein n=1 Tax=Fluviicoccus sp. TaxID=2003552 RepID=UPI0027208481|nr:ATP-binding protein [Fluviicoccus sp.]MDO8330770.1 ATP-binding protein [Fluviicoccus sp.]
MNSIKARLARSFVLIILLALAISGTLSFLTARHEVDELFDAQLVEEAHILGSVLFLQQHEPDWRVLQQALANSGVNHHEYDASYAKKVAVQVWSASGALLFRSPGAPEHALAPLRDGFYIQSSASMQWHVYTESIAGNRYWLLVAERSDIRRELSLNVAASLLVGFMASLALAVFLLRKWLVRDLLPLNELREAIGERQLDQLHGIRLSDEPDEIRPVTEAINLLFDRVSQGMERERAFIADAAHELRTPLTIIRLHAQNALQYPDAERKNRSLEKVIQGVDRNTRVVQQLLLMARLDASEGLSQPKEPVDMARLALMLIQEFRPMLDAKELAIVTEWPDDLPGCSGYPDLLGVLLRNLLENAVNYTPPGGEIKVLMAAEAGQLRLEVADSGPGVAEDKLAVISRRFVRAASRDIQGTGLGLEIAGRIVRLHDGEIQFSNLAKGGLRVEVRFPACGGDVPYMSPAGA